MEIAVARRRVNLEVLLEHRHDRLVDKKMAQAYELLEGERVGPLIIIHLLPTALNMAEKVHG